MPLSICVSLRACGIQTTEDAENLEIAKSMRAGDQKQKFNLEWPKGCALKVYLQVLLHILSGVYL